MVFIKVLRVSQKLFGFDPEISRFNLSLKYIVVLF